MEARFRIRTTDGQLLEPKTVEIFGDLVRSGVIRPGDEIYDALTGAWVTASRHPMVTLFKDPLTDEHQDPFALDLVEHPEESPEEAQRAFIERMEEERRQDPDRLEALDELPLVNAASPAVAVTTAPVVASPTVPRTAGPSVTDLEIPPAPEVLGAPSRRRTPEVGSGSWRIGAAALLVLVPATVVVVSVRTAGAGLDPEGLDGTVSAAVTDARGARPVPRTEEQIRDQAYEGFVSGVRALGSEFGLGAVPEAWLEGYYLANPTGYPDVAVFWRQYLALLERARDGEGSLYREAYLDAVSRAGVAGPVRSLRLASAMGDFEAARSKRNAHYARVRELAEAAIALDDLCRELTGRVTYEPIEGERVSADPVIEAAGADGDAQTRLEAALDRVLLALQGTDGDGPQTRAGVPGWLADGLGAAR